MIYHINYYISNDNGSEYIVGRFWNWIASRSCGRRPLVITSPHSCRLLERERNSIRHIKFEGPVYFVLNKFINELRFQRIFFIIWHIELQIYFAFRWGFFHTRKKWPSGSVMHFITPVQGFLPMFFFRLVPVKIIYGPKYFFDSTLTYSDPILKIKKYISYFFKDIYIHIISTIKKDNDVIISNDLNKIHTHSGLPYYIFEEQFDGLLVNNTKKKELVLASGRDVPIKMIEQIDKVFRSISPNFPNLNFLLLTDNNKLHGLHSNYQCCKLIPRNEFIKLSRSAFLYYALTSEQGGVAQIEQILMGNPVVCSSISAICKFAKPSKDFQLEPSVISNTTELTSKLASLLAEDINYFVTESTIQRKNIFESCTVDFVSEMIKEQYD